MELLGVNRKHADRTAYPGKTTKNAKVFNPLTGGLSFGRIPKNKSNIAEGEMYLRLGFLGNGQGRKGAFGVRHIWDRHRVDLKLKHPERIPQTLAEMLVEGAGIYINPLKHPDRPIVLNTRIGSVYLERKFGATDKGVEYSIVTAYANKNPKGLLIGRLAKS